MAAQTGRTLSKWTKVYIDDLGGTLREIPVNSINGVGLTAPEQDVSAWQDAVTNVLIGRPGGAITLRGPFDCAAAAVASASAAAPALSGSYTILNDLVGRNTPLAFGVCFGIRQYYTTTEPAFGLNLAAGTSGYLVKSFIINPDDSTYEAELVVMGPIAPSWINAIPTS